MYVHIATLAFSLASLILSILILRRLRKMLNLTALTNEASRNTTLVNQALGVITAPNSDQGTVDAVTAQLKTNNDSLDATLNPPSPPPTTPPTT